MFSRVTALNVQPGRIDELLRIYEESILPNASIQKGFKGSLLLRDPESNKALLITSWETQDDMQDHEKSGQFANDLKKISSTLSGPHETVRYQSGTQTNRDGIAGL